MSRCIGMVVIALALASGCKKNQSAQEEAKKVTPSSKNDATKDLVDADFRFRLTWPGTGWKILSPDDARHLNPDAIAGLSNDTGLNAVVIVEHVPGSELEAFTNLILEQMSLEEKKIEKSPTTVSGIPAFKIRATGKYNDLEIEFRGVILVHQEHAYQMLAFIPVGLGKTSELDTAVAAFSIDKGDVKGRSVTTTVEDQVGVGWHIANGVFESAASQLRLRPPQGWGLAVGDDLYKMNPDAEVGLISAKFGAYATVISELITGTDAKTYATGRLDQITSTLTKIDKPVRAKILGKDVELMRAKAEGGVPIEYLAGVVVENGRGYQFVGWYPAAQAANAEPLVLAALGAFESMPAPDVEKLTAKLLATPDRQNFVGATYAMRGGTYYDFDKHVRWRKPAGFWKVSAGQEARAGNTDAMIGAVEVVRGMQMELIVESSNGMTPTSFWAAVEQNLEGAGVVIDRKSETSMGGKPARVIEGKLVRPGIELRYRSTSAVVGDAAIQFSLWAPAGVWPKDGSLDALTSSIEVIPSLRDLEPGATFRDNRLGFEMALPGWSHTDETPSGMRAVASMQGWRKGSEQIMVIGVYTLQQKDDKWLIDLVEQFMRQKFADHALDAPRTETAKIAGRDVRHLIWDAVDGRVDLAIIKRDATVYGLLTINTGRSAKTYDTARTGLRLLD